MMFLSEAIRRGSKLRPQACGSPFRDGGSCALGAAYDAFMTEFFGVAAEVMDMAELESQFPILREKVSCSHIEQVVELKHMITILNDSYGWTREEIADYVEQIELMILPTEDAKESAEELVVNEA